MTAPNAKLAYRVLDHIDAHPEQWDQGLFIGQAECGTVACFAGWAVLLSGYEPDYSESYFTRSGTRITQDCLVAGRSQSVSYRAQELLGADRFVHEGEDDEADLFDQFNTREDLGRLVEEVFGPRPGPPPIVDANGTPVPGANPEDDDLRTYMAGRVPADCGHYIAASEAKAGCRSCERCPTPAEVNDNEGAIGGEPS